MLWRGEKTTPEERLVWELLKTSQKLHDIVFVEADSAEKWEQEQARLEKEGWQLLSIGNGMYSRIISYKRS